MFSPDPPLISTTTTASVGLGYGIAIAVSILVLISTIMLASYACIRVKANASSSSSRSTSSASASAGASAGDDIDATSNSIEPGGAAAVLVLGLHGSVIDTYPKIVLGESLRLPRPNNGPCCICLSDYKPQDSVRCIPDCHHCFHADCIDEWLKMTATCPLCRSSPAPTPLATPLSELVPLAFRARS